MLTSDPPVFHTDLFVPRYRRQQCGNLEQRISGMNLVPGYWSGTVLVQGMAWAAAASVLRDEVTAVTVVELPGYPERLEAAARRWMRCRWPPGTAAPC